MVHNHNHTGSWKMDIFLFFINIVIWAIVGMYKAIAGCIVTVLSIYQPKMMVKLSLAGFNEGLHTIALLLAIMASTITILLAIRNHIKQKK